MSERRVFVRELAPASRRLLTNTSWKVGDHVQLATVARHHGIVTEALDGVGAMAGLQAIRFDCDEGAPHAHNVLGSELEATPMLQSDAAVVTDEGPIRA